MPGNSYVSSFDDSNASVNMSKLLNQQNKQHKILKTMRINTKVIQQNIADYSVKNGDVEAEPRQDFSSKQIYFQDAYKKS